MPQEIFKSVFGYFPASFILSSEKNQAHDNGEELKKLLVKFAISSPLFGDMVISICMEKLSSSSPPAKVISTCTSICVILTYAQLDSLEMLSEVLPSYEPEIVSSFSDGLSDRLIDEV